MTEPVFTDLLETLYERLPEAYRIEDGKLDWVLKKWLTGVVDQAGDIDALFDRIDYISPEDGGDPDGTSDLANAQTADAAWLPWIAQMLGVTLPDKSDEATQREILSNTSAGYMPGTAGSIAAAAATELVGDKYVSIADHSTDTGPLGTGGQWDVLIITKASETLQNAIPEVQATMASTLLWEGQSVLTNLITNPSFEDGTGTNWGMWQGNGAPAASATVETTGGKFGNNFRRITWTTPPTSGGGHYYTPEVSVEPGRGYSGGAWIRPSVELTLAVVYQWYNNGTPTSSTSAPGVLCPANVWTWVPFTDIVCPAGSNQVQVRWYITGAGLSAGQTLDIDGAILAETPAPTDFFDGDAVSTSGTTYSWVGTARASASTRTVDSDEVVTAVSADLDLWRDRVLRTTADADGDLTVQMTTGGNAANALAVTAGSTYSETITVGVQAAAARDVTVNIEWLDDTLTHIGNSPMVLTLDPGAYTEFPMSAAAPVGATHAILSVTAAALLAGESLDIAQAAFREGPDTTWVPRSADPISAVIEQEAKPAGIRLWHRLFTATWDTIEADRPTWNDWEAAGSWNKIEETGLS